MPAGFSLYLDLFRLLSAIAVVLYHASAARLGGAWFRFPFGTDAVMAFFVLSGFVIAYASSNTDHKPAEYAAARLARLWSVLIPALVITLLCDAIGRSLAPSIYEGWDDYIGFDAPAWRFFAASLFLNEIWFNSVAAFSNSPVWSLGFEAWYYILFGCWIFAPDRWRYLMVSFCSLICGPKILLLMPAWLLGVMVFRQRHRLRLQKLPAICCLIAPLVLIVAAHAVHLPLLLEHATWEWADADFVESYVRHSKGFVWDNVVGAFVVIHLAAAYSLSDDIHRWLKGHAIVIRSAAGLTLSIYLLHFPVLLMTAASLHAQTDGPAKTFVTILSALFFASLIGWFIEPTRFWLRPRLVSLFRTLQPAESRSEIWRSPLRVRDLRPQPGEPLAIVRPEIQPDSADNPPAL